VRAVPRSRSFYCWAKSDSLRRLPERLDIVLPVLLVEVGYDKPATIVFEEWIHSHDVPTLEMIENHSVTDGNECLIGALTTLDSRFFAYLSNPFVRACWRVATGILSLILPASWEHLCSPSEQVPEECDLVLV
jgi:hypothetical protein